MALTRTAGAPVRILIVYSRVGGGHLSAARALAEELDSTGGAVTRLVDAYVDCGRFPLTRFPAAYAWLARDHPRWWSTLYHGTRRGPAPELLLHPFLDRGLRRVLRAERPDVVISVLPVVNGLVAAAAAQVGAPCDVVFTDWNAIHPLWVARGVRHYTAPTESARADALRFGARPECVDVVGIPVRRAFQAAAVASQVSDAQITRLGLEPARFTILAMVGAEGSPGALRSIARLARLDHGLDVQMIVVCGRNESLRRRVAALPRRVPLRAVGFVDNVAELMRAADVLVTKAGGLTLAEAFCAGVPVVVHDLLPGQEAGNLEYVQQRDAVAYAPDPDALARVIAELFADRGRRVDLARRGARLARPHAARDIAAAVRGRSGL